MKRYYSVPDLTKEDMYKVILSPVITEKATIITEYNQVSFSVPLSATKPEIRAAVEGRFDVKVESVNTSRLNGKVKKFRGTVGKRKDTKKAIVTLAEGNSIDITTGV